MEKMESSFYTVCDKPKIFSLTTKKENLGIFDRLPFFQPWVWKLAAVFGAVGFAIGWGIAEYIKQTLMK